MNKVSTNCGLRKAKPHGLPELRKWSPEYIDLLVNSKVLLNKRLNESIEQSWHSAHKFLIETGHFDYRKWTETICPLWDETHYLTQCQNSKISRARVELLEPFHKKWKGIHKLTQIAILELTKAILAWHAKMMTCPQKQDFYV